MIKLRVSETAAVSIVEQADYYQQASESTLAQRWESCVDQATRSLMQSPERGTLCRFPSPSLAGLRWILINGFPKHIIFYRHLAAEQEIQVVQVLHGARDLESLLEVD